MPTITSIKPQRNKSRVNVYIDEKFAFGLDMLTFLKFGLKMGTEISQEKIDNILKSGVFQDAYDKILRFASLRPRSEIEFNYWLKKHKIPESLHDAIKEKLKHLDLLDDKKFALWWVEQRINFRPKPKRVLINELKIKGIDKNIIEEVLSETNMDEYQMAKKYIAKRNHTWNKFSGLEKRRKIFSYLIQKGFDLEVIRNIVEDVD
jgi:regulatory protein